MRYLCLIVFCLSFSSHLWAGIYYLDKNTSFQEDKVLRVFFHKAEAYLPTSLSRVFLESSPIEISFASPEKDHLDALSWIKKDSFFQSKRRLDHIVLHEKFISQIRDAHKQNGVPREALSALLKETIRLYDLKNKPLGKEKELLKKCQKLKNESGENFNDSFCLEVLGKNRSVSKSPLFLDLAGFNKQGMIFQKRKQRNKDFSRSPDPKEGQSSEDAFLVNMEFFLTDSEYQCRRPSLYQYFSDVFSFNPFEGKSCEFVSEIQTNNGKMNLDTKRLYQIHYLFAAKGKGMGSQWGHAMFRLVLCKPGKPVGPECMNDLAYHAVISFRANVNDIKINNWKGMTGKYDSKLFVTSMKSAIDEYTKGQFRELQSIPLRLSQNEKELFIRSVLELYYGYLGSYYFFTNNCATESMKLLQLSQYESYDEQMKTVFSPLGIRKVLVKNGLADMSVFENKADAIKKGFLFPGIDENLKRSYEDLKGILSLKEKNFETFASQTNPQERSLLISKLDQVVSAGDRIKYFAKFLQLESFILSFKTTLYSKQTMSYVLEKKEKGDPQMEALYQKSIRLQQLSSLLMGFDFKGYGIPLVGDKIEVPRESIVQIQTEGEILAQEIQKELNAVFPNIAQELEAINKNKLLIQNMMLR